MKHEMWVYVLRVKMAGDKEREARIPCAVFNKLLGNIAISSKWVERDEYVPQDQRRTNMSERQKINGVTAIKKFMERKDGILPNGGRAVPTAEFAGLTSADRKELAQMAATQLGDEYEVTIQA